MKVLRKFFTCIYRKTKQKSPQQKKNLKEASKKVCYVINDQGQFKFLGKEIADPGVDRVYHYISETFYFLLKESNSKLNELYYTWYLISTSDLEKNHSTAKMMVQA